MNDYAVKAEQSCHFDDRAKRPRLEKVQGGNFWRALSLLALFMVPGGAFLVIGAYRVLMSGK